MLSHLADEKRVVEEYIAKTPNSRSLFQEACRVSPGGVMAGIKFFEPYPIFMKQARGSRIWDVDGNEYVDFLLSYGALILGHGHSAAKAAAQSVFEDFGTTVTGTPSEVEVEYGSLLRDLYHRGGLARFTNSGLEATLLAVRLAKGFTGRTKVAKFEGHYHGANDRLLVSYSPPSAKAGPDSEPTPVSDTADAGAETLADSVVLPFNDWEGTERLVRKHGGTLACVIMEPFEDGVIAGERGFMENLRRLTRDLRIPLIYDEVKTGFRLRIGGASEFYSITPDLTCLGKVAGGGIPMGAVVGDAEMMGLLDPRMEPDRRVFHSGTFNGNPLALAVGKSTVGALMDDGNFQKLVDKTDSLKKRLSGALRESSVPHRICGEGAMFNFYFTESEVKNYRDVLRSDLRFRRILDLATISKGAYLKPLGRYCLSLAHDEADLDLAERALRGSLAEITASSR